MNNISPLTTGNPFKIAVFDGGGLSGANIAAVLTKIESDLNVNFADHFDLIVGTSTGGIIALALGLGVPTQTIMGLYTTRADEIFPQKGLKRVWARFKWLFANKYSSAGLERVLKDSFGDKLLGESKVNLVIPSFNLSNNTPYLFKTPHSPKFFRDKNIPAWKVAMATSAAPTYFPVFKEIDSLRLIDGGVWANNPIMVAVIEAMKYFQQDPSNLRILSIGTTKSVNKVRKRFDFGGLWTWRHKAIEAQFRGQSECALNQARILVGTENIIRIDPVVAEDEFKLDLAKSDEHMANAAHDTRHLMPLIKQMFFQPNTKLEKAS